MKGTPRYQRSVSGSFCPRTRIRYMIVTMSLTEPQGRICYITYSAR